MDGQRARTFGHEIEGVGGVFALAALAGGAIAAAVGMLARPALGGLRQGRSCGRQRFGGIGRRVEDGRVRLGDGPVIPRPFRQQRVLFQLLLDEGGQFEMRELQQLDGLLKLRRHCQRLARSQDQTWTDTHVTHPLKVARPPRTRF